MSEAPGAGGVIRRNVTITAEQVAVSHQTLQSDGPAWRQGLGANADLSAKAVAETIGETRRAVVINASAINTAQEGLRRCAIGGANALGVCLLYTSPSPRDATLSRMPSSA